MTEHDLDSTDVAPGARPVSLTDLLRVPVRRWWLPLIGAVLGLIAGIGYLLLPASYAATAVVAVRPVVTDPFTYPGPGADRVVNMTVENGLATGTVVVAAVAKATGQTPAAAKAGLTVELPTGTQVLRFRYAAPSAAKAVAGANAAANAYLSTRGTMYLLQRDGIVKSYDASIKTLTSALDSLRKSLPTTAPGTGGTPASVTGTLDRMRALEDQLGQLSAQRSQAAAVDVTPGTVTQVAAPPVASSRDAAGLYAVLAFLGGALLGAVAAFAIEAVDRRVRTAADAAAASRFPILAELRGRRFPGGHDRLAGDLRYLSLAVLGQLGPVPHRRIVVLGATSADRAPGVATGLALALAEQGNTVRWEDLTGDVTARARLLAATTGPAKPDAKAATGKAPTGKAPNGKAPTGKAPVGKATTGKVPAGKAPTSGAPTKDQSAAPKDDAVATEEMHPAPVLVGERLTSAVPVGAGRIWLDAPSESDETMITVVRAGPTERDDLGVRAAIEAAAVVVVRRDRTRAARLERLASTLRITGARCLGVVLVTGRD
jgi:uncharacterized protein involved in exopolysaccharide biosynthesis